MTSRLSICCSCCCARTKKSELDLNDKQKSWNMHGLMRQTGVYCVMCVLVSVVYDVLFVVTVVLLFFCFCWC